MHTSSQAEVWQRAQGLPGASKVELSVEFMLLFLTSPVLCGEFLGKDFLFFRETLPCGKQSALHFTLKVLT